jgi:hypothetical protein
MTCLRIRVVFVPLLWLNHAREAGLRRNTSRIFIVGAVEVDSVVESRSSVDQLE